MYNMVENLNEIKKSAYKVWIVLLLFYCSCIAAEIDNDFFNTAELKYIRDEEFTRFSMEKVNKRLDYLPKGITLAVK